MKKILIVTLCLALLLVSCNKNQTDNESYNVNETSEVISEIPSISDLGSSESDYASSEEFFELSIDAKTAVKGISEEISLTTDVVEIDSHFLLEKASISDDMYDDFCGTMSYELSNNSSVLVFCCNTAVKATNLKKHIENIISDFSAHSFFDADTKIISYQGYTIVINTQNNFDEENLVSKLIQ